MLHINFFKKSLIVLALCFGLMLSNSSIVQAQTASLFTDLTSWEAVVYNTELFETTSGNIALADEVSSAPGPNVKIGPSLTFLSANTGLSRDFRVESLQATGSTHPTAGFTFDDQDGINNFPDFDNALSVGDMDDFEDDDWSLVLLNGAGMSAFGVDLRHNKYEAGESVSLFYGDLPKYTIDLSPYASSVNSNNFLGVTADFVFDKVVFNENPGGDDIAVADFRLSNTTVVPEPASTILFLTGLSTLGLFKWRRAQSR